MRPSNIEGIAKIIAADSRMKRNDFSEILDSSDINMTKVIMTSSIALAVSIPVLMLYTNSTLMKHPWAYRLLWGISFLTNLLTVQLPGRLDGEIANDGKNKAPLRFDTLFAPAGYAFAIWAVIYLGEILLSTNVTKTIASHSSGGDVFRFLDMGTKALELETGVAVNEPVNYAIRTAIEFAVLQLIQSGEKQGFWKYKEKEIEIPIPHGNIRG